MHGRGGPAAGQGFGFNTVKGSVKEAFLPDTLSVALTSTVNLPARSSSRANCMGTAGLF